MTTKIEDEFLQAYEDARQRQNAYYSVGIKKYNEIQRYAKDVLEHFAITDSNDGKEYFCDKIKIFFGNQRSDWYWTDVLTLTREINLINKDEKKLFLNCLKKYCIIENHHKSDNEFIIFSLRKLRVNIVSKI